MSPASTGQRQLVTADLNAVLDPANQEDNMRHIHRYPETVLEWLRSLYGVCEEGRRLAEVQARVLEGLAPVHTTAGRHAFDPDRVWSQISRFIDALLQRATIDLDSARSASVAERHTQKLPIAKHTILFLTANPSGAPPLALDQEARAIQTELERSGFRNRFEFVTRWATEPLDLLRDLRKLKPSVVHFSGHGLSFRGANNCPQLVSTAALENTFSAAGASVKLVVFSACYSEAQVRALLPHVGCVVGMSSETCDDAARNFAIGFYGALGDRESVAAAYKHGCAAVHLQGISSSGLPRLAVRDGVEASELVLAADP